MDVSKLPVAGTLPSNSNVSSALKEASKVQAALAEPEKLQSSESIRLFSDNTTTLTQAEKTESATASREGYYQALAGSDDILKSYEDAVRIIKGSEPDLLNKEWDLAVNAENELVIKTGDAGISAKEARLLVDLFDNDHIKSGIKEMQDGVIRMSEGNYQLTRITGSPEHYDLNNKNIILAIDVRDMLEGFSNNGPRNEFSFQGAIVNDLKNNAGTFLKPETENLRFVEVKV